MRILIYKNALLLLLLCAINYVFAQKQINPIQNFQSPFKSKSEDKNRIQNKNPDNQGEFKIEIIKGSFSINIEKYNLTKEQIELNLKSYLSLSEYVSFKKVNERTDDLGFVHINYQQLFNGIPIDGAIIMLHIKNGKPNSLNGQIVDIKNLVINPTITTSKALEIAKQFTKVTELINNYPIQLLIAQIPSENGFTQKLAYKVRIDANKPFTMCNVFVDAITGQVVNKISLINDADVTATANTLYSGTQSITTDSYTGGYRLRDNARKIETYDATNATDLTAAGGFVGSVDYTNNSTTWGPSPLLTSFTISTVSQNWWYTSFIDESPDLYIKVRNGSNQIVYDGRNNYTNNTFPPITIPLFIYLTNGPYTIELWDYDPVGGDDLGGTYTISTNSGTQVWSGNGNNGQYEIPGTSNNPALDVHWGMEKTYDFYKNIFNRNSYDRNGSSIKNYLNSPDFQTQYGNEPNNASALPPPYNIMKYGLGDGIEMNPVVALDVEGHEFTHMVVNHVGNSNGIDSGLVYQRESGALNESFADIFGTCVEFYSGINADWTIGEDVMIGQPFLRSMSNPNATNDPDTYNGLNWKNPNCGIPDNATNDNCGVHTNSGVQNFWFYLLCQGGSDINDLGNSYSVTGIGITKARQIAYRNLTTYLGPKATYYDSYLGSLQASQDLYGNNSAEYWSVKAAWYAVGIGNNPTNYCSGTTRLTATSGSVSDGSGSANYFNNSRCKWVIAPPGANQINVSFTSLNTELNYDTVFIHNGPDTTYPYTYWTGNFTTMPTYTSTGGAVTIRFVSDISNTAAGWSLNYTSTGITPSCNGGNLLTTTSGTFTDGSGTSNYGNNQYCYWLIAPPCATAVTLNITQFSTEAGYDGLIVYNGNSTSSPILGTYSGTTLPSAITANSGQMLVVFTSDFLNTSQGFAANYTSTGSAYCSGVTTLNTSDYGTITDGSGLNNYCNNQNCSWLIQPPQSTSITLNFTNFDLEEPSEDGNSVYDAVEVYDGATTSAPLLGRFSGNNIPPSLTSSSGSMLVRFFSDMSVTKSGWSAYYTSTSPSYCNSTSTLTAATGTLTDGSGTNQYANNTDCSWLIQPPGATNIKLTFTDFNTELNYDGVIVYNGANSSSPILGQFSGTTIPAAVTATGGKMFIRFLSDEAYRANGWTANYTTSVLPLNILDFTVTQLMKEVKLNWVTSDEFNTKDFNIEHSMDGVSWNDIGNVIAKNIAGTNSYTFTDKTPNYGINYYRLKMNDKDGKFTYSPTRTVNFTKAGLFVTIAPNPATSFTTITFNQPVKNVLISVLDAQGKKVMSEKIGNTTITNYPLNTAKLSAGIYTINFNVEDNVYNEKLVIVR